MFRMIYKDETQEVWLPTFLIEMMNDVYNKAYFEDHSKLNELTQVAMNYLRTKLNGLGKPVVSAQIFRINRDDYDEITMTESGKCLTDALEMIRVAFNRTEGKIDKRWADDLELSIYEHYYNEYDVNCYAHFLEEPVDNINYFIAINKERETLILFLDLNEDGIFHDIVEESKHE